MHGNVLCNNIPEDRVLRKFVEKRLFRWLVEREVDLKDWWYEAIFSKEGTGHEVSCAAEIVADGKTWQALEIGQNAQQAFISCLNHMRLHDYKELRVPSSTV